MGQLQVWCKCRYANKSSHTYHLHNPGGAALQKRITAQYSTFLERSDRVGKRRFRAIAGGGKQRVSPCACVRRRGPFEHGRSCSTKSPGLRQNMGEVDAGTWAAFPEQMEQGRLGGVWDLLKKPMLPRAFSAWGWWLFGKVCKGASAFRARLRTVKISFARSEKR